MTAPLTPGTRVYQGGQLWARTLPGGTGTVVRVEGPDQHGEYEYLVRTGADFSRRPGTDNPEVDVVCSSGCEPAGHPATPNPKENRACPTPSC
ncbi:hypothetical protein [Streptomyces noursei]|uniref:hypothetical protein n=1 Tax=Streptomyces noursei TaxID=1971 RepID=UPI0035D90371